MFPVQISIKDMSVSKALETEIRARAEKLERMFDRISNCRVVVESPQKRNHRCKLYAVHITLSVPGKDMVVNKKQNENVYAATQEAFAAMERQLEEHSRKRHGRVKTHSEVHHGHVVNIVRDEGYGFIEDDEGNELYFSTSNLSYPSFSQLHIGDNVKFTPEQMTDGLHACHVVRE